MAQCRHALRPDGLFLAAMLGGQTLQVCGRCCFGRLVVVPAPSAVGGWAASSMPVQQPDLLLGSPAVLLPISFAHFQPPSPPIAQELRIACSVAQQEREGGVSPCVSPLAQVRDAGNLLTRAGLSIPAVDVDEIQVHYRDAVQLVEHLRCEGGGCLSYGQHEPANACIRHAARLPEPAALQPAALTSLCCHPFLPQEHGRVWRVAEAAAGAAT